MPIEWQPLKRPYRLVALYNSSQTSILDDKALLIKETKSSIQTKQLHMLVYAADGQKRTLKELYAHLSIRIRVRITTGCFAGTFFSMNPKTWLVQVTWTLLNNNTLPLSPISSITGLRHINRKRRMSSGWIFSRFWSHMLSLKFTPLWGIWIHILFHEDSFLSLSFPLLYLQHKWNVINHKHATRQQEISRVLLERIWPLKQVGKQQDIIKQQISLNPKQVRVNYMKPHLHCHSKLVANITQKKTNLICNKVKNDFKKSKKKYTPLTNMKTRSYFKQGRIALEIIWVLLLSRTN